MLNKEYTSLEGQIIVSSPLFLGDAIYSKSVIYIVAHNSEGAFGIIVNQPITKIDSSIIFANFNIETINNGLMTLYLGGPIESGKGFILHSNDYAKDILSGLNNNALLSSNTEILKDIAAGTGPKKALLTLGYSSWRKGQLENELQNNNWLIVPYNDELIFSNENFDKWKNAYSIIGINHNLFSPFAGKA